MRFRNDRMCSKNYRFEAGFKAQPLCVPSFDVNPRIYSSLKGYEEIIPQLETFFNNQFLTENICISLKSIFFTNDRI